MTAVGASPDRTVLGTHSCCVSTNFGNHFWNLEIWQPRFRGVLAIVVKDAGIYLTGNLVGTRQSDPCSGSAQAARFCMDQRALTGRLAPFRFQIQRAAKAETKKNRGQTALGAFVQPGFRKSAIWRVRRL